MHLQKHRRLPFTPRTLARLQTIALFATVAASASAQSTSSGTSSPSSAATQAAAEDTRQSQSITGSISGYMDFHYNKLEESDGVLDFHRFVLLFNHSFTDRIRFVGELEVEHALVEGLEEKGELELEQAYIDFLITRGFNVRGGMLLTPVGIINQRHEPPVYYGVERPFVDTVIVPTTWFEVGAGVHGELARGFRYQAYLMAPLNAAEFSADEGIREGRQKGAEANVGRIAATGRVEYLGVPGLTLGLSGWRGKSGFEFRPRFDVPVSLIETDARYVRDRLELRAQYAHVFIDNAEELNFALGTRIGVDPNIARQLRGFYTEAGYRVLNGLDWGDVGAFIRYENFDTQYRMPSGYLPLREFDRSAWVVGMSYWPDPDVAVKVDYVAVGNQSDVIRAPNSFNIGLGWWF